MNTISKSLPTNDLSLFPGAAACLCVTPREIFDAVKNKPDTIAQLNDIQLALLFKYLEKKRSKDILIVQIYVRCLLQLKEWTKAIEISSDVLIRNSSLVPIRLLRAQAYFESQNWAEFIEDCNMVIDEYIPDLALLTQRCYASFKAGRIRAMLQDAHKIVQLSAWRSHPEYLLAHDLDPDNHFACLRAYSLLMRSFSKDPELLSCYARLLAACENWETLLEICCMWQLAIAPEKNRELFRLKIQAYVNLKAWRQIILETTEILNDTPVDIEMLGIRARAHARQGNLLLSLKDNLVRDTLNLS